MASWDTGLLDCFSDIKVLLVSWCCGPCQLSFQKAAVEDHQCGIGDLIPILFCGLCCQVMVRGKIREKYGFAGSLVNDLLVSLYCGLCAVSQQTRQLELKGAKPAGMFMDK